MNTFPLLKPLEGVSRKIHGEDMGSYLTAGIFLDMAAMILTESPLIYDVMFFIGFSSLIALALNHIGAAYVVSEDNQPFDTSERHLFWTSVQYYANWAGMILVILTLGSPLAVNLQFGLLFWGIAVVHVSLFFRLTCELDRFAEEET